LEQSRNIVYTGAAPNQQLIPALRWGAANLGKRAFLVGSDYVFPHAANAILRDVAATYGVEIVGEAYLRLGEADVGQVVEHIQRAKPDFILNTLNGDTNQPFFRALRVQGLQSEAVPTISFSIAEPELALLDGRLVGDYVAWTYFMSLKTPENEAFVRAFRARYGDDRLVSDPMEAAYLSVKLWAGAVRDAGTTQIDAVRQALPHQHFNAPEGGIYVDALTQHTYKPIRIGKVRPDGMLDIVWDSGTPIAPIPFPPSRSRAEWQRFLDNLHSRWNGAWVAAPPG
jgi:urea transport system substrate-binding protein